MMHEPIPREVKRAVSRVLFWCEDVIYALLGILLVAIAAVVVYSAVTSFFDVFGHGHMLEGVVGVIDNILLGLMVGEILYTVVVSFESHSLKAEPFLIVGLIAAVRRVLLISLQAAHVTELEPAVFQAYMLETGILSGLILILVVSIYLLKRRTPHQLQSGTTDARQ